MVLPSPVSHQVGVVGGGGVGDGPVREGYFKSNLWKLVEYGTSLIYCRTNKKFGVQRKYVLDISCLINAERGKLLSLKGEFRGRK